jgi:hypothetical protein
MPPKVEPSGSRVVKVARLQQEVEEVGVDGYLHAHDAGVHPDGCRSLVRF